MAMLSFLSRGQRVLLKPGGVVGKNRDQPTEGFNFTVGAPPAGDTSGLASFRIVDNQGRRVVAPGLEN